MCDAVKIVRNSVSKEAVRICVSERKEQCLERVTKEGQVCLKRGKREEINMRAKVGTP